MKPQIGDIYRDVSDGEEVTVVRIMEENRVEVTTTKPVYFKRGQTFEENISSFKENWELIPMKETRVTNILKEVDNL